MRAGAAVLHSQANSEKLGGRVAGEVLIVRPPNEARATAAKKPLVDPDIVIDQRLEFTATVRDLQRWDVDTSPGRCLSTVRLAVPGRR